MNSRSKLNEYMSQMREMEDKLRESRLQAKIKENSQLSLEEFEKAERMRREEDELRHLRELQEEERRRREDLQAQRARMQFSQPYMGPAVQNYAAELARQKQQIEMQRLAALQQQVLDQEEENRKLQEQLNAMFAPRPAYGYYPPQPQPQAQPYVPQQPYVQPQQQYVQPQPYAQPQQQYVQPQPYAQPQPQPTPYPAPAQIYITQTNTQPSYSSQPAAQPAKINDAAEEVSAREKSVETAVPVDKTYEAADSDIGSDAEKKTVTATDSEVPKTVSVKEIETVEVFRKTEETEDDEPVAFNERLTFAEAYTLLTDEQRTFCDGLRAYAREESGAKEFPAKYHLSVGNGQKVIVKLTIKNGICFAHFRLEDERLRSIRRSAAMDGAAIKIKETSIPVSDDAAFRAAKEMVDLRLVQLEEYIELQKQRAAERRKLAKLRAEEE